MSRYGIIGAQMLNRLAAADPFADALLVMDFVNGFYRVGEDTKAAADVVDKPARIGASGLHILDNDADGVVEIVGDARTVLLSADWTLQLAYEELNRTGTTKPLIVGDPPDNSQWIEFLSQGVSGDLRAYAFDNAAFTREAEEIFEAPVGVHVVALTRTDDRLKMSINGRAVLGSDSEMSISLSNKASFGGNPGGFSWNECHIRSLVVWAPRPDGDLPSLSI